MFAGYILNSQKLLAIIMVSGGGSGVYILDTGGDCKR